MNPFDTWKPGWNKGLRKSRGHWALKDPETGELREQRYYTKAEAQQALDEQNCCWGDEEIVKV